MRSLVVCSALSLLGCVSFPSARLDVTAGVREELKAPVVCGPMGFRKTPLQSRWGESVRVTVRSPGVLRGSAFVHANGEAGETRSWSTEQGELVVEARFENLDPDRRYLLVREQPIDITLTGLEGACEGAVFTVEQGELVPDIDERAWLVELERRGGPELLARREAARLAAEARRQAHYAAWEARQQVEISAEVVVTQNALREAHYAQWEAQRNPQPAEWETFPVAHSPSPLQGERGEPTVLVAAIDACTVHREVSTFASSNVAVDSRVSAITTEEGSSVAVDSRGCSPCALSGAPVETAGVAVNSRGCGSCATGVSGIAMEEGSSVAVVSRGPGVSRIARDGSSVAVDSRVVIDGAAQVRVEGGVVAGANVAVGSRVGCASCAPPQVESEWELPEQGRLREVIVSTEQHPVASSPTAWAPVPAPTVVSVEAEEPVTAVEFVLPALFQFMVQASVPVFVAPAPPPSQRVVRAVPITPR